MKRIAVCCVIAGYLGALSWGIISHTLSIGAYAHPGMYYIVWDMFCGWSGYEYRNHLIAEGESGKYYRMTPAPWGDFQPYGPADRLDYDSYVLHTSTVARNILKQTAHEPILRVFLVEECWSKRYNIPDYLWSMRYDEPKQKHSYYHVRAVLDQDANVMQSNMNWVQLQMHNHLISNPELKKFSRATQPFFAVASPDTASYSSSLVQTQTDTPPYLQPQTQTR